ncbi:sensor histidine kinase [Litoreibacter janthinus]|uniref:histidine kinase n=1 Tax=Litoreibacter janthinus TaxID=670154 RepID=A0A1I6GBS0_9RHOB|nr:sensor histidine kinase [Litoreibacter janthinus]SFR39643.1 Two-component sensor histidine kinase, contains HisKA and HATPase domains [Litoreibacter janthinus]
MTLRKFRDKVDTLAFRVVFFLSLALLPIGLIAVNQSRVVTQEAQNRLELSLIAWTDLAATQERELIQGAVGAAEALSAVLPAVRDDPEACFDLLSDYLRKTPRFSLIGFPDAKGQMTCSSAGRAFDFSSNPVFKRMLEEQEPFLIVRSNGRVSGESVIVVLHPYFKDDVFDGYVVISIPHTGVESDNVTDTNLAPLEIVTFNTEGEVLTSSLDLETVEDRLPHDRSLKALTGSGSIAFREFEDNDHKRIYTVTPILENRVYALSIWDGTSEIIEAATFYGPASLFPLLMWLASLVVAYMSLNGLVLSHIKRLRKQMGLFAKERRVPDDAQSSRPAMARELREMEDDFIYMAQSLLQDEASMEEAVREKNILLKEVHHRVKNNLQLISSIMNMHMRKAKSSETKSVLRRLQDRILGLSAVHRNLYQTDNLNHINAGNMLSDVVGQMISVGVAPGTDIKITRDIADITLYPDQAVPLALLTSEAVTNALKYVGTPTKGRPTIDITFAKIGEAEALLRVVNSKGAILLDTDEDGQTGLGSKLIRSFSIQLGAQITIEDAETEYAVNATFKIADFSHEALDY